MPSLLWGSGSITLSYIIFKMKHASRLIRRMRTKNQTVSLYLWLSVALLAWVLLYLNLQNIARYLVFDLAGLTEGAHLSESVFFMIYEVPKVFLLLVLIIFIVGYIRSYFSAEKTRAILEGKSLFTGNILAAMLGVVTPFCSCSAIPLFLGFVEAGIPLGVTFSFLIAAPLVNEVAVVLLFGLFGWKVTVIYLLTGLVLAIIAGWTIGRLKLEKYVMPWVYETKGSISAVDDDKPTPQQRIQASWDVVVEIIGKIWIYILLGIAVGAIFHGYIPEDFLSSFMSKGNWYSVPLAIILGVPMYSNAAGVIPIISVLIEKGVPLGTAIAFMMSVIGLSLPEIIILKKVIKWPLIAAFTGIVTIGIICIGFLLNNFL